MSAAQPPPRQSKLAPAPTLPPLNRQPSSSTSHSHSSSGSSHSSHSSHSSVIARKRQEAFGSSAQEEEAHAITRPAWSAIAILALVALSHLAGLHLFTSGFLLRRDEVTGVATCDTASPRSLPAPPRSSDEADLWAWDAAIEEQGECTLPAAFDRAVVLIIDALRYDFIAPIETPSGSVEGSADVPAWSPSPHYHSHFLTPSELDTQARTASSSGSPSGSFLAHFLSDAPTTTLQRLKGLTTGTLPTFIDAGSNFGGEAIGEDNWLKQFRSLALQQAYGSTNATGPAHLGFMGDDTWLKVYPQLFDRDWTHFYDSFNVEDLHTVDNGVREKLLPFFDSSRADLANWRLLVAHTLGLDHVGHRHTPAHPLMTAKLRQMDTFVKEILAGLPEDALFILAGDHGMDAQGDHGGEGELEVGSGLWIYSKRSTGFSASSATTTELDEFTRDVQALSAASETSEHQGPPAKRFFPPLGSLLKHRSIPQVDLVPSLSLLLGTPPPFGNLGSVTPELFPPSSTPSGGEDPSRLLRALRINARQIRRYLKSSGPDLQAFSAELEATYLKALKLDAAAMGLSKPAKKSDEYYQTRRRALVAYQTYNRLALHRARSVWAVFSDVKIVLGLILLIASIAMVLKFILLARRNGVKTYDLARRVGKHFGVGGVTLGIASALLRGLGSVVTIPVLPTEGLSLLHTITSATIFGGQVAVIFSRFTGLGEGEGPPTQETAEEVKQAYQSASSARSFASARSVAAKKSGAGERAVATTTPHTGFSWAKDLLAFSPVLAHSLIFASNSLVVWEDSIVHALLVSVLLYRAWAGYSKGSWLLELSEKQGKSAGSAAAGATSPRAIATRSRQRIPYFMGGAVLLVRLVKLIHVCREEQAPLCTSSTFHLRPLSVLLDPATSTLSCVAPLSILAMTYVLSSYFLPLILRSSLAQSKSDTGLVKFWCEWIFRTSLMLGSGWWIIDWIGEGLVSNVGGGAASAAGVANGGAIPAQAGKGAILQWGKNLIARVDFALVVLIGMAIWFFAPLCLEVKEEEPSAVPRPTSSSTTSAPLPSPPATTADQAPAQRKVHLLGFSNAFGSNYLLFLSLALALCWIVTPPAGQLTLGATFLILILLAEVGDAERDLLALERLIGPAATATGSASANNRSSLSTRTPSTLEIVTLHLFSHLIFFSTGHQATFLSIQWRSAFIGWEIVTYPWSPLLVVLNSFAPMVLLGSGLALPLLVSWNLAPLPRAAPPPPPTSASASPSASSSAQGQAGQPLSAPPQAPSQRMRTPLSLLLSSLTLLLSTSLLTLSSALFATLFRRHLMLFKIWAPRYMLAGITLLGVDLSVLGAFAAWMIVAGKVGVTLGSGFE
ncbi:hypothetical protein BCV69DRAFT_285423 [Microstroma glucosiphilum]|uniref:Uncharacterized protein n=1 Tax=Pseudomicrostroma glucosiphilum TaxID=1684307 RepID=A0A316TXM1_9BASI|nr:hypothetical protein BCV69DRAFT_285423 [Pseudomicrostroma glucosiphilum]PWN18126.1 hypothetical protein BCV69DRAFT_285423 [Pseudomicrostroma glucosiphilum]